MGRYGAYPAYKASEVAWLGEVPAHWDAKRLKYVAMVQPSNVDKKSEENELPVFLCNYSDVYNNETISADIDFMSATATPSEISKFLIAEGDVIITKDSESPYDIAVPAYVEQDFENTLCGYHLTQIRGADVSGKYLFRLFQSRRFNAQFVVGANGVTRFGLPQHIVNDAYISLPPLPEQQAIARFLDHKTAQIDALIAKKEALLARLADKRTALISEAVTKGLDPAAPMKDSGIDWLGEIPAHWEIVRFSHFIDFQEGPGIMAADFHEDGVPLLRIVNLKPGYVDLEGCNYLDPEKVKAKWQHFRVFEDDLLISSSASTGLVSLVDNISAGSIPYTGIIRLRPARDDVRRRYIEVFVGSELFATQINLLKTGTTIQHYGPIHLRQMKLPLPPPDEQEQISDFVLSKSSEIDGQSATIRSAIDKLKQYRTALITHAVTGKIDVRGVALPD